MATRCHIGMQTSTGAVLSIYCHNDGYLSWTGKRLQAFDTLEKVEALIGLGDCSSIGDSIEDSTAYHRDRGESYEDTRAHLSSDLKEFESWADEDYTYLFADGVWLWRSRRERNWQPLRGAT